MPCFAKKEGNGEKAIPSEHCKISIPTLPVKSSTELDKYYKLVHEDLVKRKSARPRRVKSLKGTMQARCGKEVAPSIIDAIFTKMVKKGFVRINGEKVTYAPPES